MPASSCSVCHKLGSCAKETLLSPFLSGSLLLAITYADKIRDIFPTCAVLEWLRASCLSDCSLIRSLLWWHLGLATVRRLNHILNTTSSNSWQCCASLCCTRLLCKRSDNELRDKVAVVTGGSSGIGKRLVERMVRRGVDVAVLDVQDLPKSLENEPRARFYRCDVSKPESVAEAADAVRRELGHPSILINNAGIVQNATILDSSDELLHRIFGVNCLALWHTTKQFLPHMVQQNEGHVVTVASIASFVGLATAADYSATKAGALAFHETLTTELRHSYKASNVRTTVVHPSFVRTPLLDDVAERLDDSGIKMLTPDDVAEVIMDSLRSKKGGQVVVPGHMSFLTTFRAWPAWVQHAIRDFIGYRGAKMQ
ncbi:Protein dhs-3 [Paramyrothecium foliicola]|nr:Protein dhs-3 [Paramyrothecium foliicola]